MELLTIAISCGVLLGVSARAVRRWHGDYGRLGLSVGAALGAVVCVWAARHAGLAGPASSWQALSLSAAGGTVALAALLAIPRAMPLARATPRGPAPPDPNLAFDAGLTIGQRVADRVAAFGGSWTFIGVFLLAMVGWMLVNEELAGPFDPYPFILLNLVLSCVAALQAPVIMMSQNRQAAKDRSDAKLDYEVNLRAEARILDLHAKLDAAREEEWRTMVQLQREQVALLARLEARLGADAPDRPARQG